VRTNLLVTLYILTSLCFALLAPPAQIANAQEQQFYTSWKLMNNQEKQQFIAGYMMAYANARKIAELTAQYSEHEPAKALESLRKLPNFFTIPNISPGILTQEVDTFYSDPENWSANFSKAVSASVGKVKQ